MEIMSSLDLENDFLVIETEIKNNLRILEKNKLAAINNSSLNELNILTDKLKHYENIFKNIIY